MLLIPLVGTPLESLLLVGRDMIVSGAAARGEGVSRSLEEGKILDETGGERKEDREEEAEDEPGDEEKEEVGGDVDEVEQVDDEREEELPPCAIPVLLDVLSGVMDGAKPREGNNVSSTSSSPYTGPGCKPCWKLVDNCVRPAS